MAHRSTVTELPWERAAADDPRYAAWARGDASAGPWRKLEPGALELMRRVLRGDPARRATLDELRDEPWSARDERLAVRGEWSPRGRVRY